MTTLVSITIGGGRAIEVNKPYGIEKEQLFLTVGSKAIPDTIVHLGPNTLKNIQGIIDCLERLKIHAK